MTTYEFIIDNLQPTYPAAIPAVEKYWSTWTEDDKPLHLPNKYERDLSGTIYPYMAAYQALVDAGVENPDKVIFEMMEKELM